MDRLKKLELSKLVHELEFIRSDYEYKSELIQEADKEFIDSVNKVVDSHPELKKIYNQKINKNIEFSEKDQQEEFIQTENQEFEESVFLEEHNQKDPKIKNLYRSIVKKTHPDKIGESKLNSLYIESTKYYQQDDLLSLYRVCDKLGIEYEFEESDYLLIQAKINQLKDKIRFLESTFTWLWINSDETKKDDIILNFVRLQLA